MDNNEQTLEELFHSLVATTAALQVGFSAIRRRMVNKPEEVDGVVELAAESIRKLNDVWEDFNIELKKERNQRLER